MSQLLKLCCSLVSLLFLFVCVQSAVLPSTIQAFDEDGKPVGKPVNVRQGMSIILDYGGKRPQDPEAKVTALTLNNVDETLLRYPLIIPSRLRNALKRELDLLTAVAEATGRFDLIDEYDQKLRPAMEKFVHTVGTDMQSDLKEVFTSLYEKTKKMSANAAVDGQALQPGGQPHGRKIVIDLKN